MKRYLLWLSLSLYCICASAHIIPEGTYECLSYSLYYSDTLKLKSEGIKKKTMIIVDGNNIYIGVDQVIHSIFSIAPESQTTENGYMRYIAYDLKTGKELRILYSIENYSTDEEIHFIFEVVWKEVTEVFDTKNSLL